MASVSVCISLQILLSCLCWALGPVSDYKSCGDPACASMMSRVQALRDHRAQDCRFLSFKKGDMIVVYYKLSGKRSDLWAGSIDTRSGLFPKDAVKIDEVFVDEEKEINVPTQKYDFYCTEEFDSIESDSSENHEDRAEQNEESGELGNSDSEAPVSKPTETNDDIQTEDTSQTAAQEPSKQDLEEPKKSGSSWIGSAVNGWFGGGEESHDEAAEESRDEESFRSRKLALDPEENRLRVETQAETTGWIGDVTNVFGFGQKVLKDSSKDLPEDIVGKEQDSPSTRSGWLGMGINDVLGFGAGDTSVKSEVKAENGDINPKSEESIEASQSLDGTEASENDKTDIKQGEDNEASSSAEESVDHEAESEDVSEKQSSGWYGNVYNRISSFYGDPQDKTDVSKEDGSGSSSEADFQPPTQSTEDLSQKECGDEGCVRLHEENPSVDEQNLVNDSSESSDSEDISDDDPLEGTQSLNGDTTNSDRITTSEKTQIRSEETALTEESVEPGETQNEGDLYQYAAFFGEMTSHTFTFVLTESAHLRDVVFEVVSSLPEDLRPGPDLYGFPWELVLFSALCGSFIFLLFSCRFISSIKGRLYASKEKRMGQKVAELLEEKCKVLETLSECKHKFEMLETSLQNGGVSAQASERQNLEVMSKKLEQSNAEMKSDIERLQEELENQSKFRKQQEEQLAGLEETLQNLEEEAKTNKTQLEQDKTTLKIHDMNSERLQKKLQAAKEENVMLIESKAQLVQESEGWAERLSELEEEMRMCERSHCGMVEDCTNKDERIKSLTECLLKMKDWDSEEESSDAAGSENGEPSDLHQKQKVQKLISAAKMCADLKAMEEDKDRVFAKLSDEVKAKEDLREGIEQLEMEKESLDTESSFYSGEIQKLQQKLQIMTEMYQENELKLHRMLTVEERERSQKEEKLSKAGKKISLAAEELNTYRQRAKELEEELERTNQAYKNQVASHEKKAHDNWLAARAADRDLADLKRENTLLRQRLTDYQFKLELMEKEPYPRESLVRPVFRGERSPFGPSPLGRPSSETRAFLSPPTLMDGPPRISPQFPMVPGGRVSRGVVEPPAGGVESDRSGALSDSGSVSPSWERERRGFGVSPGGPPPDAGIPYRRPPPGPFPLGPPASRPLPPDTYYGDKSDVLSQGNTSGLAENEGRESLQSMTGDVRAPPEMDMRMGPPPAGPPMGLPPPLDPRDPHFPRRLPYGPPDFYPLRGPAGSPLMRGPHPPGMFPRPPLPHPMAYPAMRPPPDAFLHGPPLRPPPADSFHPGPPPRPSPPGSEQPPEQPPSPHQNI
ncbi:cTAGE family member 5 [Hoplias malabaricus]|uniref:cTAGE family member 5 n=1 Tax=Hoplias malabaricus TaxID=27720 RepID=UPI003462355F